MALGSTQSLAEMRTKVIFWMVKAAGAWALQPYRLHVPTVLKFRELKPSKTLRNSPDL
jgi:hypothetical protein